MLYFDKNKIKNADERKLVIYTLDEIKGKDESQSKIWKIMTKIKMISKAERYIKKHMKDKDKK